MIRDKFGVRNFTVGRYTIMFMSNYEKKYVGMFKYINDFSFIFVRV